VTCYIAKVIAGFRHKGLKRLFDNDDRRGINPQHAEKIENILGLLDSAKKVEDMSLPSFRLHMLSADLNGFWSVTVRASWRVIFRFEDGRAFDVDLVDYH
jgi:toxin HigB-1